MMVYSGSNPNGSWFEVWKADDGYSLFAVGSNAKRVERHELSWSEATDLLSTIGAINI